VIVAGVHDVRSLTPFEREATASGGCAAVLDSLVPSVTVAAYYQIPVVACGVVVTADSGESEGIE
jgi:hypothetical protein